MNILLTGATSGIGWETFKSLWKDGHHMILPIRNMEKARKLLSDFGANERVFLYTMDLADLKSVQTAATQISNDHSEIDIIINNAGGMFPARQSTVDGLDETFAVNHLGHFLLTTQLITLLPKEQGKVINVSSTIHKMGKVNPSDFGLMKSTSSIVSYANAKLYNILFSKGLRDRFADRTLQSYALHPGAVNSSFGSSAGTIEKAIMSVSKIFFISSKKGAETTLFLANTPVNRLANGGYYDKKKLSSVSSKANDMDLVEKMWKYSESELERILG